MRLYRDYQCLTHGRYLTYVISYSLLTLDVRPKLLLYSLKDENSGIWVIEYFEPVPVY